MCSRSPSNAGLGEVFGRERRGSNPSEVDGGRVLGRCRGAKCRNGVEQPPAMPDQGNAEIL
jgi:hypothetical protein